MNPQFPASWIPALGWLATVCEASFGIALILGFRTKIAAIGSGVLTLIFALAVIFSFGITTPLNYCVFAFSAGAFLMAFVPPYPWSLDNLLRPRAKTMPHSAVNPSRYTA